MVPFSALTGENVDRLVAVLAGKLPACDAPFFDKEVLTDQAERQLAAEYVREALMLRTRQEIPYAAAVEVEVFDESQRRDLGGLLRIGAVICLERESQKAIVIGKKGAMLKLIGTQARQGLEKLLACKVYLELTVKVVEHWSEREAALRRFGL